ncbi:response regulator [Natronoarchaeum sp. GCM10025703]|uniref:response regulator n=1 Tax=Natronoarchaeum sp. GCM10025703 TaxID=3252685 RepID=UPI00360D5F68
MEAETRVQFSHLDLFAGNGRDQRNVHPRELKLASRAQRSEHVCLRVNPRNLVRFSHHSQLYRLLNVPHRRCSHRFRRQRRNDYDTGPRKPGNGFRIRPPLEVLVVDDNPRFGELAEMFLEDEFEDIAVETATSAGEGERLLNEHDIDCVVSDYQMPERDGIEFLQAVREESPDLPFILMTGNGDETVASRAITAGVTDYIPKEAGSEHYDLLPTGSGTSSSDSKPKRRRRPEIVVFGGCMSGSTTDSSLWTRSGG